METYRLKSKLVGWKKEYIIQTTNDTDQSVVSSVLIVDGVATGVECSEYPGDIGSEEILELVRSGHDRTKDEIEGLLGACRDAIQSGDSKLMTDVGLACLYKQLNPEARELLSKAIVVNSEDHSAYLFLSQVELALGQPEAAVQAAELAVELRPRFADYRNNLGVAHTGVHRYRHAIGEFEKAIEINLYYAEAYFNLGLALVQNAINKNDPSLFQGVLSRSEEQFNRAAMINSEYKGSSFEKGLESLRNSDLQGAYDCMNQVREDSWERRLSEYATIHLQSILHPEWSDEDVLSNQISFLQQEVVRKPTYVDLAAQLGHCYLQQARLSLSRGLEQYRSSMRMNASLKDLPNILDQGEICYAELDSVLSRIPKKGWSG